MYVAVAINLPPVRGTFDYNLPPAFRGHIEPGHLVVVPFGHRRVQGVVVQLLKQPSVPETKPIEALIDPEPVLNASQLALAAWIQSQTFSPLIECLTLMLPPGLSKKADSLYSLKDPQAVGNTPVQKRILNLLLRRGPLRGRQIGRALPRTAWKRSAESLVRRDILDRTSVLDAPTIQARRVRTARLAVPPQVAEQSFENLGRPGSTAAQRRKDILSMLVEEGEPLEVSWIYAEHGATLSDLRLLEQRGLVALGEAEIWRDPLESFDYVPSQPLKLTTDQSHAWEQIRQAFASSQSSAPLPFLLHGVTGSGKTEIYLHAVAETIKRSRQAVVLVPEIALTPQTVRRFLARFPGQVGLIHSQLSDGERFDTWRRLRTGSLQVVIGPRSALFAPLPDIGLIVVDESHDDSYKQSREPRYHARETAIAYAGILKAVCILGSATPDVVTMHAATHRSLTVLALPNRILGHRERLARQAARLGIETRYRAAEGEARYIELPPVSIIDMRQELRAGNRSIFSRALQRTLQETVDAQQQAILFLNRRGTSTYIFCRDCGEVLRCPRCETQFTYHSAREKLMCHHCGYTRLLPQNCPNCNGRRIKHFGAGTQRVQAELEHFLPGVRSLRWDWDATRTKGAHEVILANFAAQKADILIGTQMLAKGLDLPLVTLVGVISADVGLNMPDYRAPERTFQVLTQVAGRAGRGLLGGRVILQTFQPEHYVIQNAAKHDYHGFLQQELQYRRNFGYPPFSRLVRLIYRSHSESAAEMEAQRMARHLAARIASETVGAEMIGPAPCFYRKIGGLYRWHIVLRAADPRPLVPEALPEGWSLDVDPVSLL